MQVPYRFFASNDTRPLKNNLLLESINCNLLILQLNAVEKEFKGLTTTATDPYPWRISGGTLSYGNDANETFEKRPAIGEH